MVDFVIKKGVNVMTIEEFLLNNLRDYERALEFVVFYLNLILKDFGLISSVESRIKSGQSTKDKVRRKKVPVADITNCIRDIAGARVIVKYKDWIPALVEEIKKIPGLTICGVKDYIANPKKNGYSGYHLDVVISTPTKDGNKLVPVEIQIRTLAQHVWATIEHEHRYAAAKAGKEVGSQKIDWLFRRLATACALVDKIVIAIRLLCAETKIAQK